MRRKISLGVAAILAALPSALLVTLSPASGANSLQSILSPAGLSAYETATADSYFAVSQTDFDNAATNLASVTKLGAPDSDRTTACPSPWSPDYITVINNSIIIPANAYVLGYSIKMTTGTTSAFTRLVTASTYKGSYSPIVGANYPSAGPGMNYYLFKEPATVGSIRYVGQISTGNMCPNTLSTPTGGYRLATVLPSTGTFSSQTANTGFLQLLYTTVDQWSIPTTISLSTSGGTSVSTKGGTLAISTTQNKEGLVTFKANGKNIPRCISLQSSGLSVTCNWKPSIQGTISVTAILRSPTSSFSSGTSAPLRIGVGKRTTTR